MVFKVELHVLVPVCDAIAFYAFAACGRMIVGKIFSLFNALLNEHTYTLTRIEKQQNEWKKTETISNNSKNGNPNEKPSKAIARARTHSHRNQIVDPYHMHFCSKSLPLTDGMKSALRVLLLPQWCE